MYNSLQILGFKVTTLSHYHPPPPPCPLSDLQCDSKSPDYSISLLIYCRPEPPAPRYTFKHWELCDLTSI